MGGASELPRSPSHNVSLEFQDIAHSRDSASLLHPDAASSSDASLPLPAGGSAAGAGAAGGASAAGDPNASFYQLAYYQCYFDVTTSQIVDRLLRAYFPFRGKFYRDDDGSGRAEQADLYGPFWICTTLVFLLAAAGNFANYLQFITNPSEGPGSGHEKDGGEANAEDVWSYDFRKVTIGASVFYAWISFVPLALYCFFKHAGGAGAAGADAAAQANGAGVSEAELAAVPRKGLAEIASLFGYALAWLLPVCLLCIPPWPLVRWVSVGVAFGMSSLFLLSNLAMMDVRNRALLPAILAILGLNFAIALLTKFYFFDF